MPLCLTMENFKCLGSDSNMSLDEVFNMRASLRSLDKKDNNATPQLLGKPRMISLDNSSSLSQKRNRFFSIDMGEGRAQRPTGGPEKLESSNHDVDYFYKEEAMNHSIRSKPTERCQSINSCMKVCQHKHEHNHFMDHVHHVMHEIWSDHQSGSGKFKSAKSERNRANSEHHSNRGSGQNFDLSNKNKSGC